MNVNEIMSDVLHRSNEIHPFNIHLGNEVIIALSKSGLSISEVAHDVGVKNRLIEEMMYGSTEVSDDNYSKILYFLYDRIQNHSLFKGKSFSFKPDLDLDPAFKFDKKNLKNSKMENELSENPDSLINNFFTTSRNVRTSNFSKDVKNSSNSLSVLNDDDMEVAA